MHRKVIPIHDYDLVAVIPIRASHPNQRLLPDILQDKTYCDSAIKASTLALIDLLVYSIVVLFCFRNTHHLLDGHRNRNSLTGIIGNHRTSSSGFTRRPRLPEVHVRMGHHAFILAKKQSVYFGDEALTQRLGGLNGGNCEPMESQVPPMDFLWKAKHRLPTGSPQVPPAFPQARPSAGNRCAVPTVTRLDRAIIIGFIYPCACIFVPL